MARTNRTVPDTFKTALEAIANLAIQDLERIFLSGQMSAMSAHAEIEIAPVNQKTRPFYRHLLPLWKNLVLLLTDSYRRFFKLALAHPRKAGSDPHDWAWGQLKPAVSATLEWIRDWYILACEGENQSVRHVGSIEFVPGQTGSLSIPTTVVPLPPPSSWRAPAWLFEVSPLLGFRPLKEQHIPANNSEVRLGEAHTRLLLKGARRVFLGQLAAEIERVRNEEIAAAGAIRIDHGNEQERSPNKRRGWQERLNLYDAIRKVLRANPSLEGMEFCAELDKRHALPLYDWVKCGQWREGLTWKEAWSNSQLRSKIRRVRQEAMKSG